MNDPLVKTISNNRLRFIYDIMTSAATLGVPIADGGGMGVGPMLASAKKFDQKHKFEREVN